MRTDAHRFSVAPMMEWTDRHCRFFHRLLTRRALLYTEMITADAILHGDCRRLLGFSPEERLLLKLRFEDALPVPRIAEILRLDSEFQVYRRLKKILATMRERLENEGIHDPRP